MPPQRSQPRRSQGVRARGVAPKSAPEFPAVFLVGFMGAGKTTVGKALARRLKWQFVDLDDRIVEREGRTIADIFRDSGEAAFRAAETAALEALLREVNGAEPVVVALGGGAFVQPQNAALLKGHGSPVVFLDAPVEELYRRCQPRGRARPLLRDENQFRQLYEQRRSGYMAAGVRVETGGKTVSQAAAAVLQRLTEDHRASHRW